MATTTTNSVSLKLGYSGTNFTRTYKFTDVQASALSSITAKVKAYNANIPEDDKIIFIADDYDGTIGKLESIIDAEYRIVTTTTIEE